MESCVHVLPKNWQAYYYNNIIFFSETNPKPEKLYTFTEEYGLPDASADSFMTLWQR